MGASGCQCHALAGTPLMVSRSWYPAHGIPADATASVLRWHNSRNAGALLFNQHSAQDLAGERLGDGIHELEAADLLVGRHPLCNEGQNFTTVRGAGRLEHDECLGNFARLLIWAGNYSG